MPPDLVSVVMPVYNGEAFIAEAIASVHAQTCGDWQLFVVDDCSSDGSVREAQRWCDRDPRIKVLRTPGNAGSSAARNLGISHCTGRYVAFLDADDVWVPAKLEKQLKFMTGRDAGFSFTAYRKLGTKGPGRVVRADTSVSWRDMLKGNRIGCSTVMLDTRAFPRISFPTELGRQEDYALWLSLLRGGGPAYGLDEALVLYRVHSTSKSARKFRSVTAQWHVYRDLEKLSRPVAAWYLAHYAVRGVLKALL
jgi:teichuronic acid biosynthesis glycosyltransferase TuaG